MQSYVIRRVLLFLPVLFLVTLLTFFSQRFLPGDATLNLVQDVNRTTPAELEALKKDLGLDKSPPVQYGIWMRGLIKGDLGDSFYTKASVVSEIKKAFPVSLELAVLALLIGLAIAIPVGVLSAVYQDTWVDYVGRFFAVVGLSVPNFIVATLVILLPAIWWGKIPPVSYTPFLEDPVQNIKHMILPALVVGTALSAGIARITRSSMLEVLGEDYIRTAHAKGLAPRVVFLRHALKNAAIAPLTIIGGRLEGLVGGAVIVEQIFGLPGMGRLSLVAIQQRDYSLVQANVLLLAFFLVAINLLVDLAYGWVDPRIRYD